MSENLERMIRLADEFFQVKNDPSQIAVDSEVLERLRLIDPDSRAEMSNEKGPIAWILLIPTTREIMEKFISALISERELLDQTLPGITYDAVYLCSALVLPEYRRKGLAKTLAVEALRSIRTRHPVKCLFVWSFSREGDNLAEAIADACSLPLYRRFTSPGG